MVISTKLKSSRKFAHQNLLYTPTTLPSTGQTCSTSSKIGMQRKMRAKNPMNRKAMSITIRVVLPILFLVRVVTMFPQYGHWKLDRGCSPNLAAATVGVCWTTATYMHTHAHKCTHTHTHTHVHTHVHTHTHTSTHTHARTHAQNTRTHAHTHTGEEGRGQ